MNLCMKTKASVVLLDEVSFKNFKKSGKEEIINVSEF